MQLEASSKVGEEAVPSAGAEEVKAADSSQPASSELGPEGVVAENRIPEPVSSSSYASLEEDPSMASLLTADPSMVSDVGRDPPSPVPGNSDSFPPPPSSDANMRDLSSDSGFGGSTGLYDPKYCTPHFFNSPAGAQDHHTDQSGGDGDHEVEGLGPMPEHELESIGNSILNDLDDMMMSGPFNLTNHDGEGEDCNGRVAGEDLVDDARTSKMA